jgi:hypothetical protein
VAALPAEVMQEPERECRPMVVRRLERMLGSPPDGEDIERVMTVVKRIQLYRQVGRSGMSRSFRLDRRDHVGLLRAQAGRCGSCGYRFLSGDLEPDPSSGELPAVGRPVGPRDKSPRRLARRAVIDHVFPVYLAGDSSRNWQVLCTTCNQGKSDMLLGFEARAWFSLLRPGEFASVGPRLFYMVLKRDRVCIDCRRGVSEVELRIVRRNVDAIDTFVNLTACCIECFASRRGRDAVS